MAGLPVIVDLVAYRGDTFQQTFRLKQGDELVDLDGATVACWARHADHVFVLETEVTGEGEIAIRLPIDQGTIHAGDYVYDVEVTGSTGGVTTWIRGRLRLQQDVTNFPEPA